MIYIEEKRRELRERKEDSGKKLELLAELEKVQVIQEYLGKNRHDLRIQDNRTGYVIAYSNEHSSVLAGHYTEFLADYAAYLEDEIND